MARKIGTIWEKKDVGSLQKLNEKTIHPMRGSLIQALDVAKEQLGLVSRYAFGGNGNDSHGTKHLTAGVAPTYVEDGTYGKAADFERDSNHHLDSPNATDHDQATNDFWVSFFWTPESIGNQMGLVGKRDESINTNKGWMVMQATTGAILAKICDGSAASINLIGNTILQTGKRYWILVKWDRDGNMAIYIDGVQDGSVSITSQQLAISNAVSFRVGEEASSFNNADGIMDHLQIGTTLPDDGQIRQMFTDMHAGQMVYATTTEDDFVKDNLYVRDAENVRWVPDGIFKGTGAEIAALAANGMTVAGLVAYCTSTGGGFEAGDAYLRNGADDGWDRLPRSKGSIDTELGFRAQAKARFYDADDSHYIGLHAPAVVAASVDFILPGSDGAAKDLLGTGGAGALAFFRPNMTPLHMDDTQSSQACSGTEVTLKSYSLPANSYTRILVIAAGEWDDVFDSSDDPDSFSAKIEIGASSKSMAYNPPQFTSGQVSDNSGDMRWFLMFSAVQAGPATIAVKGDHNGTDAKSIRCDTFYVFGMNY